MDKMERLSNTVKDLVIGGSAVAVGIATTETLRGGPPSTELSYVLPEARSAVVFALPLNQSTIETYLKKEDLAGQSIDNRRVNTMASGIALEVAEYLSMKGYKSLPVVSNGVYRKDVPGGHYDQLPPLSHRYLAIRSGIGHFGLSGNVLMDKYGAAIILASAVTVADLIPTDALPKENNYCDDCRLCMATCASGLMAKDEKVTVNMGGIDFTYSQRRNYNRCGYVCGGFAGLHPSGKWSTWSPARFPIPERGEDFISAMITTAPAFKKRPRPDFGCNNYHPLVPGNLLDFTCGHCQFVCHPDKEVRKQRYKMISGSGVVIQEADGSMRAVSSEEAKDHLAAMEQETRALYEEI